MSHRQPEGLSSARVLDFSEASSMPTPFRKAIAAEIYQIKHESAGSEPVPAQLIRAIGEIIKGSQELEHRIDRVGIRK